MNSNAPKRIRIAVTGLKGQCPRPLDDGGTQVKYSRDRASRQRCVELFVNLPPIFFKGEGKYDSVMCYNAEDKMDKRDWIKKRFIPLLTLLLVIAITVGIFLYREKVAELQGYGYLGAFLASVVSNATIILPVPGIIIILALGAALPPVLVGLAAGIGAAIGEMTCYMVGYSGQGIVENRRLYDKSAQWLKKWGVLTVFVFAVTPSPFDVMGMVAGLLRYPFWKFFLACLCGKILKYIGIAVAGAFGWEMVSRGVQPTTIAVLAALATGILLVIALAIEDWSWKRGR